MFKQILWIIGVFILLITTLAQAKIVFTSSRDGTREIYVMNDDGSRVQRLTDNQFLKKVLSGHQMENRSLFQEI